MDRVAVITGASRGVGAATALLLAQRRLRVVVNYRSSTEEADAVVETVKAAGGEAWAIRADVTDPDDVALAVLGAVTHLRLATGTEIVVDAGKHL